MQLGNTVQFQGWIERINIFLAIFYIFNEGSISLIRRASQQNVIGKLFKVKLYPFSVALQCFEMIIIRKVKKQEDKMKEATHIFITQFFSPVYLATCSLPLSKRKPTRLWVTNDVCTFWTTSIWQQYFFFTLTLSFYLSTFVTPPPKTERNVFWTVVISGVEMNSHISLGSNNWQFR